MPEVNDHDLLVRLTEQVVALNGKFETFTKTVQESQHEHKEIIAELKKDFRDTTTRLDADVDKLKNENMYFKGACALAYAGLLLIAAYLALIL